MRAFNSLDLNDIALQLFCGVHDLHSVNVFSHTLPHHPRQRPVILQKIILPHHFFNWYRPIHINSFTGESGVLIKSYDDAAEEDIKDFEVKLVLRILFGK